MLQCSVCGSSQFICECLAPKPELELKVDEVQYIQFIGRGWRPNQLDRHANATLEAIKSVMMRGHNYAHWTAILDNETHENLAELAKLIKMELDRAG